MTISNIQSGYLFRATEIIMYIPLILALFQKQRFSPSTPINVFNSCYFHPIINNEHINDKKLYPVKVNLRELGGFLFADDINNSTSSQR
jgi:hypothetical protein